MKKPARPLIAVANRQLRDVTDDAIDALCAANDPPHLFSRDGEVVRVKGHRGKFRIQEVGAIRMRNELAHAADWTTLDAKNAVRQGGLTKELAENVLAERDVSEAFPNLNGLAASPFMDVSGRIVRRFGYDPESEWYLAEGRSWPQEFTDGPAAARWVREELYGDFRFADEASAANAMGLFLCPFVRAGIDGPTPLHLIDAPTPGSGKGLLAAVSLFPGLGYEVPATPLPTDEVEVAKTLYSMLREGSQAILFDNVRHLVKSPSLEACLTARVYKARVLQASAAPEVRVESIFAMTANNGKFSGDAARRCAWIRIDPREEDPEARTDFRHASLLDWAAERRGSLVSAALAMCEHWVREGMPKGARRKGSYERWAGRVGGILGACGIEGFLANDKDLKRAVSEEDEQWRAFYGVWWSAFADARVSVKELRGLAEERELLDEVFAAAKSDKGRSTAFGRALKAHQARVLDGLAPESMPLSAGLATYRLRVVGARPVEAGVLQAPEQPDLLDQPHLLDLGEEF